MMTTTAVSLVPEQDIAEMSIQLAGFDVYYADVIENKLMNRGDFDYFASYQYNAGVDNDAEYHIASHSIAHKELSNGKTVVIIAIMGTGTEHDGREGPYSSNGKWQSNLTFKDGNGNYPNGMHYGFKTATDAVLKHLMEDDRDEVHENGDYGNEIYGDEVGYLDRHGIDPFDSNVIFLITGHSRGAAVGNLLSASLNGMYNKNRIFSYNYAVPNVVREGEHIGPNPRSAAYNNILNTCNWKDLVTKFPTISGPWTRHGEDIMFWGEPTPGVPLGAHRAELYQKWVYSKV